MYSASTWCWERRIQNSSRRVSWNGEQTRQICNSYLSLIVTLHRLRIFFVIQNEKLIVFRLFFFLQKWVLLNFFLVPRWNILQNLLLDVQINFLRQRFNQQLTIGAYYLKISSKMFLTEGSHLGRKAGKKAVSLDAFRFSTHNFQAAGLISSMKYFIAALCKRYQVLVLALEA